MAGTSSGTPPRRTPLKAAISRASTPVDDLAGRTAYSHRPGPHLAVAQSNRHTTRATIPLSGDSGTCTLSPSGYGIAAPCSSALDKRTCCAQCRNATGEQQSKSIINNIINYLFKEVASELFSALAVFTFTGKPTVLKDAPSVSDPQQSASDIRSPHNDEEPLRHDAQAQ